MVNFHWGIINQQILSVILGFCFFLWYRHQTGEGSIGSGSSSGGGGHSGMKGTARQRSPGAMARNSETMDDSANPHPSTAEPDEFAPSVHPPTDDEGVHDFSPLIFSNKKKLHFHSHHDFLHWSYFSFLLIDNCVDSREIRPRIYWRIRGGKKKKFVKFHGFIDFENHSVFCYLQFFFFFIDFEFFEFILL